MRTEPPLGALNTNEPCRGSCLKGTSHELGSLGRRVEATEGECHPSLAQNDERRAGCNRGKEKSNARLMILQARQKNAKSAFRNRNSMRSAGTKLRSRLPGWSCWSTHAILLKGSPGAVDEER